MALRLAVVLVMLAGLASCRTTTTWEQAVAEANRDNVPLVVEFYADWCRPCHWFEKNVLAAPEVRRELESVRFERLDFDSRVGRHHARRLGVRAVPTIVAVDARGNVIGGLRGAAGVERFLRFLRWTHEQRARSR